MLHLTPDRINGRDRRQCNFLDHGWFASQVLQGGCINPQFNPG